MFAVPDQLIALHRQSLESVRDVAFASFAGMEKLAQLNVQAARSSLDEGVDKTVSMLGTKDVKAFASAITETPQPASDHVSAYAKHVYAIATETGAEIQKIVEKQFSEGNRQMTAAIEAMAKSAPVGSEGVVTLVRSAVTAANSAWDQVNKATRQVVELTEANVATATGTATEAARSATRRKAA